MKKIIVLGAGLVGKAIAIDLSKMHEVSCADIQLCSLKTLSPQYGITALPCDFKDFASLRSIIQPFDLVISAVPGHIGFDVLRTIIEEKKNVVDISFFPEDPFELDELAKNNNVTAIIDCGVAPGMCNIIAGYHHKRMKINRYECLVGGLPVNPEWPFNYKAVFSPADVIEEYVRPARYREDGQLIIKEALSEVEKVTLPGFPELEAFNTDGLRTLLHTMPGIPNMKEKTLRYPGHGELMRVFKETGFFGKETIGTGLNQITPLEITSKLLFPKWKMLPQEEDFTVMKVTIQGDHQKYSYTLLDHFDKNTGTSAMARTTGYTCSAAANLVMQGLFKRNGICPPEFVGEEDVCFEYVLNYLKERNVVYKKESVEDAQLTT